MCHQNWWITRNVRILPQSSYAPSTCQSLENEDGNLSLTFTCSACFNLSHKPHNIIARGGKYGEKKTKKKKKY